MADLLGFSYSLIKPLYRRTSFHRSVIEEVKDERLQNAYAECRAITRKHAKTFYMATRFLPNEKQRGIFAIYGLCRYIDDLVDEAEDLIQQKKLSQSDIRFKLDLWKQKLADTYQGQSHDNPILIAFSDVLKRNNIPISIPFELMEGVSMDLYKRRYQTFDEVYDYSYKVAATVGLMTSEVFKYQSREALAYAIDLGIAMQLTNIIRDVGEDLKKDRIYLPKEDLERFSITERDLFNHTLNDPMQELIAFQIGRARQYYDRSDKGIPLLSSDSRLPVYLARNNYSRILDKVEKNKYNVFDQRAYLNATEKISILPRVLYQSKW